LGGRKKIEGKERTMGGEELEAKKGPSLKVHQVNGQLLSQRNLSKLVKSRWKEEKKEEKFRMN